jgi:deoxycytidylate deaminase
MGTVNSAGSRPDIVVGLVGAVGTDLGATFEDIKQVMLQFGYECHQVRLSALISASPLSGLATRKQKSSAEDKRIGELMDAGNRVRSRTDDGAAVALLAVREIYAHRLECQAQDRPSAVCYVLNSLKHKREIEQLRAIYNRSFFAVSVYSTQAVRLSALRQAISRDRRLPLNSKDVEERAQILIDRDQNEPDNELGQNVRDAFYQADTFVESGTEQRWQLERFIRLLFGDPTITPTLEEHAMFHARAAALRSADLSRQVGASIVSAEGQIISVGCNEVPRAGGGHFWPHLHQPSEDDRDFRLGRDPNARMIRQMLIEVVQSLKKRKWFNRAIMGTSDIPSLVERLFATSAIASLKELRAGNLIEFGRIVHAEMSAIVDAARRGVPIQGTSLVCTTFPCHMCARHIIGSGIGKVVYIEPYPKSLTAELYPESVSIEATDVDRDPSDTRRVIFSSFIGVSPNKFAELFSYRKGKDSEGFAIKWKPTASAKPRIFEPELTVSELEAITIGRLTVMERKSQKRKSKSSSKQKKRLSSRKLTRMTPKQTRSVAATRR